MQAQSAGTPILFPYAYVYNHFYANTVSRYNNHSNLISSLLGLAKERAKLDISGNPQLVSLLIV